MEATEALFVITSDEEKEEKEERDTDGDIIPDLVDVSGSSESESSQ